MYSFIKRSLDSETKRKILGGGVLSALLAVSLVVTLGFMGGAFWSALGSGSHPNLAVYTIDSSVAHVFADYEPYDESFTPNAPVYSVSSGLSNIANLNMFPTISIDARAAIERNGFVVLPQDHYSQIHEILTLNEEGHIPSFVSSDAVLHAFHVVYDLALRETEVYSFWDLLGNLSESMLDSSYAQYETARDGRWKEAALRNVMFFAVAVSLIDDSFTVPGSYPTEVSTEVSNVLQLIDDHSAMSDSWFMGYEEDFTQFVPRGHYTRSEILERYFLAMMWYGRVSFRLQPYPPSTPNEAGRDYTAQAILISLALKDDVSTLPGGATGYDIWDAIYEPTAFFVGSADDLIPSEYLSLISTIYGHNPSLAELDNDDLLNNFIDAALEFREPLILGHPIPDVYTITESMGMRFMGQRYIPDSYILGQLVYTNVGTMWHPRVMPSGFDVMAALGSERAWELLDDQKEYENYVSQMEMLWEKVESMNETEWTSNLYYLWLYSLLPLLSDPGEGYPFFMQSDAWVDKQLSTALGSWTELRHDTILYAKQSYTMQLAAVTDPVKGYVEPMPRLYARLASLCAMMIDGLDARNLLSSLISSKLNSLHDFLLSLCDISVKELEGVPLNGEDFSLIEAAGKTLDGIVQMPTAGEYVSDADDDMAVVADVHTDPNTQEVLEEAVGWPMVIYVAVSIDGQVVLTRGGIFSYYEFTWPMSERLTDESWQQMLIEGNAPSLPAWTGSFVSESNVTFLAAAPSTRIDE